MLNLHQSRGDRDSSCAAGQALRRRDRQFRRGRDGQARPRLRQAAQGQARHHHDLDVRLWADRSVQGLRRLWTAGLRSLRDVLRHRLPRAAIRARSASPIADPNAGIFGAFAIMAALLHRALTGEGQYIDQSQLETALVLMPEGLLEYDIDQREPERHGNHDRRDGAARYATRRGRRRQVGLDRGRHRRRMARALRGRSDSRSSPTIRASRAPSCASKTRPRSTRSSRPGPASAIAGKPPQACRRGRRRVSLDEQQDLAEDPHSDGTRLPGAARTSGGRQAHPRRHPVEDVGNADRGAHAAPVRGADTDEVFKSLLGFSQQKIDELRQAEIIK